MDRALVERLLVDLDSPEPEELDLDALDLTDLDLDFDDRLEDFDLIRLDLVSSGRYSFQY